MIHREDQQGYLTPAQASPLFPAPNGRRISVRSIVRKILAGELRAVRGPRGWLITETWVEEHLAGQVAKRVGKPLAATVEQRALRARAILRARGWAEDPHAPAKRSGSRSASDVATMARSCSGIEAST